MLRKRYIFTLVVILALASIRGEEGFSFIPAPGGTIQTPDETVQTPDEALRMDAQMYANMFGVSLDEALRRLSFQPPLGDLQVALMDHESDTFGGMWIQNEPSYHIYALFTRDGEATLSKYTANGPLANVIEVRTAKASLKELASDQSRAESISQSLDIQVDITIDIIANQVDLYVTDADQYLAALQNANLSLPPNVVLYNAQGLPQGPDATRYPTAMPRVASTELVSR